MTTIEKTYARYDTATLIKMKYLEYVTENGRKSSPWSDKTPNEIVRTLRKDINEFQDEKQFLMKSLKK